jgi:hypothetical protein
MIVRSTVMENILGVVVSADEHHYDYIRLPPMQFSMPSIPESMEELTETCTKVMEVVKNASLFGPRKIILVGITPNIFEILAINLLMRSQHGIVCELDKTETGVTVEITRERQGMYLLLHKGGLPTEMMRLVYAFLFR